MGLVSQHANSTRVGFADKGTRTWERERERRGGLTANTRREKSLLMNRMAYASLYKYQEMKKEMGKENRKF